jgi:uncharacterized membrane protein
VNARFAPFWLTHHTPDGFNRCVAVGPLRVCARCLGTYPTALLLMGWQWLKKDWQVSSSDTVFVALAAMPALVDWAFGQFYPQRGTNLWRVLTGVGLGLGIGRALFLHLREPLGRPMQVLLIESLAVAVPVLAWRWWRES